MEPVKRILNRIIEWVCVVLLAVVTILVTLQVVMRYFSNGPNAYTESLSEYMFVRMVMYGSAYVFGLWEYMDVGSVRDHMPSKAGVVVEMLGKLMVALFAAGVVISGDYKQVTSQAIQVDAASQTPVEIVYPAVPVSVCFVLFHFICNEIKLVKKLGEIQEQRR